MTAFVLPLSLPSSISNSKINMSFLYLYVNVWWAVWIQSVVINIVAITRCSQKNAFCLRQTNKINWLFFSCLIGLPVTICAYLIIIIDKQTLVHPFIIANCFVWHLVIYNRWLALQWINILRLHTTKKHANMRPNYFQVHGFTIQKQDGCDTLVVSFIEYMLTWYKPMSLRV